MGIHQHLEQFAGLRVIDYPATGRAASLPCVLRIRAEYDGPEFSETLADFLENRAGPDITALVIGSWVSADAMEGGDEALQPLADAADQLPNLKHLFVGDIIQEESEISWIQYGDAIPLIDAYPRLETFHIRTSGLSLQDLNHSSMKSFAIQSGGLDNTILQQVFQAKLPQLEELDLWLGSPGYGGIENAAPLAPLLSGKLFPKLKRLALRNAEVADAVARSIATSPLLARLATLDLSLGTLGDEGGAALLGSADIKKLERLDLHHHYMSEGMIERFHALGIEVDTSERKDGDEYDGEIHRYNLVSE